MTDWPPSDLPLTEAGRYRRLKIAREHALVVSAMGLPYWIERDGNQWLLLVEERSIETVRPELAAFDIEEQETPSSRTLLPAEKIPTFSLYLAGWILSGFYILQQSKGESWTDSGAADNTAILHGKWWLTITALTLHADGPHIIANLATGLLFAAFVIPHFGAGVAWLAILLSGALGNALNSWGYRAELHSSIGASTACFGALGLLVGAELLSRWSEPRQRNPWQLVLPLGAGLALLAYLGVGDEGKTIDFMAHGWGFAVGLVEGAILSALRIKERLSPRGQRLAGILTLALVAASWVLARTR